MFIKTLGLTAHILGLYAYKSVIFKYLLILIKMVTMRTYAKNARISFPLEIHFGQTNFFEPTYDG